MWDVVIKNGLVFDGHGGEPKQLDIGIQGGVIAAKGVNLPIENAKEAIDASRQWVMPGLLDIHTHLDLEVEIDAGLGEVIRNGTTTVLVGNCSLGLAYGKQEQEDTCPIVDCFARVENVPKHVLNKIVERVTWDNPEDYLDHLDNLPLGPNIATFLPHSMLRIEVMGLKGAIFEEASDTQLKMMADKVKESAELGYLGLSTDGLPYHYLANEPFTDKRIPTQYATDKEIRTLLDVLRESDLVWQTTPFADDIGKTLKRFFLTSGRFYKKPLKVSALAALDFVLTPKAKNSLLSLSKFLNSNFVNGQFHFQALSSPFRMWGDGCESPMFEELPSTSRLIAIERDDREARLALLNDPEFIEQFKEEWFIGRRGINRHTLLAKFGILKYTVIRDLDRLNIDSCPFEPWNGARLDEVYGRLMSSKKKSRFKKHPVDSKEQQLFNEHFADVEDEADFFLAILRLWDRDFRWWVDIANVSEDAVKELIFSDYTLPGFNDSGAHLTNLAFYDGNLVTLQLAQKASLEEVSRTISRLTKVPAAFFNIDVGVLDIGHKADITIINPEKLKAYDTLASRELIYRDCYENHQLVNRHEGIVTHVLVGGQVALNDGSFIDILGSEKLGGLLRSA